MSDFSGGRDWSGSAAPRDPLAATPGTATAAPGQADAPDAPEILFHGSGPQWQGVAFVIYQQRTATEGWQLRLKLLAGSRRTTVIDTRAKKATAPGIRRDTVVLKRIRTALQQRGGPSPEPEDGEPWLPPDLAARQDPPWPELAALLHAPADPGGPGADTLPRRTRLPPLPTAPPAAAPPPAGHFPAHIPTLLHQVRGTASVAPELPAPPLPAPLLPAPPPPAQVAQDPAGAHTGDMARELSRRLLAAGPPPPAIDRFREVPLPDAPFDPHPDPDAIGAAVAGVTSAFDPDGRSEDEPDTPQQELVPRKRPPAATLQARPAAEGPAGKPADAQPGGQAGERAPGQETPDPDVPGTPATGPAPGRIPLDPASAEAALLIRGATTLQLPGAVWRTERAAACAAARTLIDLDKQAAAGGHWLEAWVAILPSRAPTPGLAGHHTTRFALTFPAPGTPNPLRASATAAAVALVRLAPGAQTEARHTSAGLEDAEPLPFGPPLGHLTDLLRAIAAAPALRRSYAAGTGFGPAGPVPLLTALDLRLPAAFDATPARFAALAQEIETGRLPPHRIATLRYIPLPGQPDWCPAPINLIGPDAGGRPRLTLPPDSITMVHHDELG